MHNPEPPRDHIKMLELIEQHPSINPLPLLELLVQDTPEYLEAFCNQAIITVAELLREDQSGGVLPSHVLEVIVQLHTLREAFRKVRGAPVWP